MGEIFFVVMFDDSIIGQNSLEIVFFFYKTFVCNGNMAYYYYYYYYVYTEERGICKHSFVAQCVTGSINSILPPLAAAMF